MQADKDLPEDTVARADRELAKSEQNYRDTEVVVSHAKHLSEQTRAELRENHWANAIYRQWIGRTE